MNKKDMHSKTNRKDGGTAKLVLLAFLSLLLAFQCSHAFAADCAKAIFTLTTFNADGTIHASSHGIFIRADGTAISTWTPFVGAARAVVVDADGQQHEVETMQSADELYDVCRFRVNSSQPTCAATLAKTVATKGSKLMVWQYSLKKAKTKPITLSSVETFGDGYGYYLFSVMKVENMEGCPVTDASGNVLGLLQKSKSSESVFATDARYVASGLADPTGLSVNDVLLSKTGIRVDLPSDYNQAAVMLMLAGEKSDSADYAAYIDDFIDRFPTAIDGYSAKARQATAVANYDMASSIMATALDKVEKKDAAHSEYADIIYKKCIYKPDSLFPYSAWSLDKALLESRQASAINDLPVYTHQQAQIVYSQRQYKDAYDLFMKLSQGELRSGEIFYEAAQCKKQMNADKAEVLALLDSAIAASPQPLNNVAAPYVLARAVYLDELGETRQALQGYNVYDTIMLGRASADFYYTRYSAEVKLRQYQQALNDIAHAAVLSPANAPYLAEMASLQLQLKLYDDAIKTADLYLKRNASSTDALLIRGLALIRTGKKDEGMASLQQAKDLGDARAQDFIDKNK